MRPTVLILILSLHVFGAHAFINKLASQITSVFRVQRRDDDSFKRLNDSDNFALVSFITRNADKRIAASDKKIILITLFFSPRSV